MKVKPNTTLYASDDTDLSITEAKDYIRRFALTSELVKLVRVNEQVLVVAKKEFELERSKRAGVHNDGPIR